MDQKELKRNRFLAPGIVAAIGMIPIGLHFGWHKIDEKFVYTVAIPVFCLVVSFVYRAIDARNLLWHREVRLNMAPRIQDSILSLAPRHLGMTDEEIEHVRKLIQQRTEGIFWGAVDGDPMLLARKPFFYENGFYYTTAIDVVVISTAYTLICAVLLALPGEGWYFWALAVGYLSISALAFCYFLNTFREAHIQLIEEQSAGIAERRSAFVRERIEDVVRKYREGRVEKL